LLIISRLSKKFARGRLWLLIAANVLLFHSQAAIGASCDSKAAGDIRIALDVGHTAADAGATSARGVREYVFNLKLARRIEEELLRGGFRSTQLMVTQEKGARGLLRRAQRANKMNAHIFISIHHDAIADAYLQPWTYEGEQKLYSDRSKGFSLHISPENREYGNSLRFARILSDRLLSEGLEPTTNPELSMPIGVKAVDSTRGIYNRRKIVVLDFARMTAILLESGVIVNRDEELAVSSEAHQGIVAAAIVDSIRKFCGVR
jgi:N-acetylmuramoyl-L-alanine amidase